MANANARAAEFVTAFVGASERYRRQYIERWEEIVRNFMVQPEPLDPAIRSPYRRGGMVYSSPRRRVVLKDGETHKVVMTHAAQAQSWMNGIETMGQAYADKPVRNWG